MTSPRPPPLPQTSEDWQALHDILAFDMQLAENRKQRSFTIKGKRRDR